MVRGPNRSRGCLGCRQRKKKCDEALPTCTPCLRRGLVCTGPVQGMFFVNKTPDQPLKKPRARRKDLPSTAPSTPSASDTASQDGRCSEAGDSSSSFDVTLTSRNRAVPHCSHVWLPSPNHPSNGSIFEQLFLDHFVSIFDSSIPNTKTIVSVPWMRDLPSILTTSSAQSRALKYSIRAVSMGFYGQLTNNPAIIKESHRWYSFAVGQHRATLPLLTSIDTLPTDPSLRMPSESDICATVLFCYFEAIYGTTPNAWLHHLSAAGKMIEMRGPSNVRSGIMHQIFRTIRLQTLYLCGTTNETPIFTAEEWHTEPFLDHPKTQLDTLIDLLLWMPNSLDRCEQIRMITDYDKFLAAVDDAQNSLKMTLTLIQSWWESQKDLSGEVYDFDDSIIDGSDPDSIPPPPDSTSTGATSRHKAMLAGIYYSALCIGYSILDGISGIPNSSPYATVSTAHGDRCLAAMTYLSTALHPTWGLETLLMVPCLKCMVLWSPSVPQQRRAVELLDVWAERGALRGLCQSFTPMAILPRSAAAEPRGLEEEKLAATVGGGVREAREAWEEQPPRHTWRNLRTDGNFCSVAEYLRSGAMWSGLQ